MYLNACNQAMAETAAYAGRMTGIALQLAQMAMTGGMPAGSEPDVAEGTDARTEEAAPVPDLFTSATQWQSQMMRNVSDWQQQVLRNMPAFTQGRPDGGGARATHH